MSLNSYNLINKYIPYPAIYSLNIIPKATTFLPSLTAINLANSPPEISLKTPTEHEFSIPQVPRTPNVPDFDPIPPEKPSDPTPEFPGPPKSDPEIQPPEPDMPVPPNTPGGPEVVPPRTPEWTPPDPPNVAPQHPAPPEIPLPYA